jgi:copper/silver efflux system protein
LRYGASARDDIADLGQILVERPNGPPVPITELAQLQRRPGSPAIRSENGLLVAHVLVDWAGDDLAAFVASADQQLQQHQLLPAGYYRAWGGQYEAMQRAMARLGWLVPLTVLLIAALLLMYFRRPTPVLLVLSSLPFALIGGVWLQWWLAYPLSVAVGVGYIALAGLATQTGVVMLVYLQTAWAQMQTQKPHARLTQQDLWQAVMTGAAERLRPKMMTVCALTAALLPLLWSDGVGHEIMQRVAAPMLGGMLSSMLLTLLIIPVLFFWIEKRSTNK